MAPPLLPVDTAMLPVSQWDLVLLPFLAGLATFFADMWWSGRRRGRGTKGGSGAD